MAYAPVPEIKSLVLRDGCESGHRHPNDDNDPCNGRRQGNATEYRASDRPVCCHRAELDRRQRRLGVDSGFHRRVFCERSLWRLAYARAVRTTQIANAPGGKIFAQRGAMDTGTYLRRHKLARHPSGKSALSISRHFHRVRETTACVRILCDHHSLEWSAPLLTGDSFRACDAVMWGVRLSQ
jgi:hypothetical protein